MLDAFFQRMWYEKRARGVSLLLLPLSWLFGLIAALRRAAYRWGVLESQRISRPVFVVGNLTVGGVGKTPFTIWLATRLESRGLRVGVVLRGYGGRSGVWPRHVAPDTKTEEVGDEAVLLAERTGAIVVAAPDRAAAARRAVELGADVVIADDGLQHYALARDCEIAVVDGQRALGNERLLPAGPLREPPARLSTVDLIVWTHRTDANAPARTVGVNAVSRIESAVSLLSGEVRPLSFFAGKRVHAVAGIGNPKPFFAALAARGLEVDGRALPDHAPIGPEDLRFSDDAPVLMTEKDAVKCRALADPRLWAVRLELELTPSDEAAVNAAVERVLSRHSVFDRA